jgi:hypothetical protein
MLSVSIPIVFVFPDFLLILFFFLTLFLLIFPLHALPMSKVKWPSCKKGKWPSGTNCASGGVLFLLLHRTIQPL